jgi:hypothetical protein
MTFAIKVQNNDKVSIEKHDRMAILQFIQKLLRLGECGWWRGWKAAKGPASASE